MCSRNDHRVFSNHEEIQILHESLLLLLFWCYRIHGGNSVRREARIRKPLIPSARPVVQVLNLLRHDSISNASKEIIRHP
mmetsp:Transcript_21799/g.51719  ORF Transcript_21799/g.51719 Transcript_21799/m.51719 type:complete len:80 (+) Transcript_21799:235-474(+)